MAFWARYLALFRLIFSNRRFRVVLEGNYSQEYPINAGVPQGSILGHTIFLLYINELREDVICNNVIYADDATLYLSVISHQLNVAPTRYVC